MLRIGFWENILKILNFNKNVLFHSIAEKSLYDVCFINYLKKWLQWECFTSQSTSSNKSKALQFVWFEEFWKWATTSKGIQDALNFKPFNSTCKWDRGLSFPPTTHLWSTSPSLVHSWVWARLLVGGPPNYLNLHLNLTKSIWQCIVNIASKTSQKT